MPALPSNGFLNHPARPIGTGVGNNSPDMPLKLITEKKMLTWLLALLNVLCYIKLEFFTREWRCPLSCVIGKGKWKRARMSLIE
jgi:hypothetical protein